MAGATTEKNFRPGFIAVGEVGLTGQVRSITGVDRRLSEAARLGFTDAIVPDKSLLSARVPAGLRAHPVTSVSEAVRTGLGLNTR